MIKNLFILVLGALLLSGCSNEVVDQESVANLEREIEIISERLEEKESELQALYQQLEESKDKEYIKIDKEIAPRLWNNPDTQLWEYVIDFSFAEENGWIRGTTNWRSWDGEFDQSFSVPNQTWETPGLLISAWMSEVETS
ncbi:hypothetical protein DS745_03700 [Anaerobacillus alkaliphilus]|uniref:Lipoprotein n=1 Tax=Anaerobacillus alkaliphilus TaxID=1548597 RepID=A0A4Q0VZS6_9BACI|nr:hypothetical protein [Anaerobacillus alkaliphilus]RXJ04498.1 hypothetical protein DS745_03700 [Anaerobacillus alkaliphilus]